VKRQVDPGYRQAIKELRRNPEAGFEKLDAIGAIHEVGWQDRAQAVAQAFSEGQTNGCNALVVCATHDEINRVTETIRESRKRHASLKAAFSSSGRFPLNWTTAQKSDLQNFRLASSWDFTDQSKASPKTNG